MLKLLRTIAKSEGIKVIIAAALAGLVTGFLKLEFSSYVLEGIFNGFVIVAFYWLLERGSKALLAKLDGGREG